jgi:hypothetical protein
VGDVVPYIFCLGTGGESSKTGQADKVGHPDELRKADKDCLMCGPWSFARHVVLSLISLNPILFFENRLRLLFVPVDITTG